MVNEVMTEAEQWRHGPERLTAVLFTLTSTTLQILPCEYETTGRVEGEQEGGESQELRGRRQLCLF